jgi:hypothetical protein
MLGGLYTGADGRVFSDSVIPQRYREKLLHPFLHIRGSTTRPDLKPPQSKTAGLDTTSRDAVVRNISLHSTGSIWRFRKITEPD